MDAMRALLDPQAIAVVGASQRPGRGRNVVANLRDCGFSGEIFAVNPRYPDVLGYPCVPSVRNLPPSVDCLLLAVAADATCDILEEAFVHGIRAAIVLAAGFGEGGHGEARAARLLALTERGMCICGPNCFGLINVRSGAAAYSGPVPRPLRPGPVALVSQSGGLGASAFAPLMTDRALGFSHFVSCGNQIGTTIEDYIAHFVDDPDITVIAAVVEQLKNPQKLTQIVRAAHAKQKTLVFFRAGRSTAGEVMIQSHTGALAGNSEITVAFLRRCGIIDVDRYDEFVEAIELFAVAPRNESAGRDIVVISGSGGGAAIAVDALHAAGIELSPLHAATQQRMTEVLPAFGSVTNPIDGTGAIYDDPELLPKIIDAVQADPRDPVLVASLFAKAAGNERMRGFARTFADAARTSGRTIVAYQYSPLGGPLDAEIVETLHAAKVPLLLGTANAMGALRYLAVRRDYRARVAAAAATSVATAAATHLGGDDFLSVRNALVASGIPVVDAGIAHSENEATALLQRFGTAVAVKAEAPGLLHKSDISCVRLNCSNEREVAEAYRAVMQNARKAGFERGLGVLVQPMVEAATEVYAGIIDDPMFGPAICFGLGGVFIEILQDAATEMAPLAHDDAIRMIRGIKGVRILDGARGRERVDVDALATLLVNLGNFAIANRGRFRTLDLNPIMVGPSGAIAVDIAIEPATPTEMNTIANAAE